LEAALEAFPDASVYTLVYRADKFKGTSISKRKIHTSFIDRFPGAHTHHRAFLPLMPFAIEQFDLREYDVVVSFSYAVAHGILPRPGQLHIAYMHTPLRYAWQGYPAFMAGKSGIYRMAVGSWMHAFRKWDTAAASRIGHLVTVSGWMADCIRRAYGREADVLYPPVDVASFPPRVSRKDFYLTVSRLVPHKRLDLVVSAFNRLGLPLVIIGEGPERTRLQHMAGKNITLLGWQSQPQMAALLGEARGFIHAGEEDFGIAMVEAQAAGCPVIALKRGGACEIVREGVTGELFERQDADSLVEAVRQFERHAEDYGPAQIHQNAERFDRSRFVEGFARLVHDDWFWSQQRSQGQDLARESWVMPKFEQVVGRYEE
jgi:glycosyltransferase involved in cell wall biosynthesis